MIFRAKVVVGNKIVGDTKVQRKAVEGAAFQCDGGDDGAGGTTLECDGGKEKTKKRGEIKTMRNNEK